VKVSISDLNIRKGPGTDYARTQYIPVGIYTIVEVKSGKGSTAGWGRLKSGAGWISLAYDCLWVFFRRMLTGFFSFMGVHFFAFRELPVGGDFHDQ
jgi:hypothetical protein